MPAGLSPQEAKKTMSLRLPTEIDIHIGKRMRAQRLLAGKTLSDVSAQLDVAWQQVAKYESGENRCGAARLYQISRIIGCDIRLFFPPLDDGNSETSRITKEALNQITSLLSLRAARAINLIASDAIARALVQALEAIASVTELSSERSAAPNPAEDGLRLHVSPTTAEAVSHLQEPS